MYVSIYELSGTGAGSTGPDYSFEFAGDITDDSKLVGLQGNQGLVGSQGFQGVQGFQGFKMK